MLFEKKATDCHLNHPSDKLEIKLRRAEFRMEQAAKDSWKGTSNRQLFYQNITPDIAHFITYDNKRPLLAKLNRTDYPALPKSLEDFVQLMNDETIEKFGKIDGKPFYREIVRASSGKAAVLFGNEDIKQRSQERDYCLDETFASTPRGFYQVLIVGVKQENKVIILFPVTLFI